MNLSSKAVGENLQPFLFKLKTKIMNNRKPKNNRGVLTRNHRNQYAPEAQFIKQIEGEGEDRIVKLVPNHRYPGTRRIVHYITPSAPGNLWGYTGQVI